MDTKKKINVTILGASGEIGLSLAKKYLKNNDRINLFYRNNKNKTYLKNKLDFDKYKNNINLIKLSTSNEKVFSNHIKKNKKIFNKKDLLILTVGEQGEISNFFGCNLNKFKQTFFVNFMIYVIFFRNIYSLLNKKKKLLIILFSGGGSTSYRRNFSSYSLSKICLVKLTEIISNEIKNKKIRFNILSPGIIDSKMTRKIINEKNKVSKNEILKIKKNIKNSEINITKIFKTINFLNSKKGRLISGKLISSAWDKISNLDSEKLNKLVNTDIYTLRRKEF